MESLDVLLLWMEQDPVDTWELGRNDAVQAITGTRNVFVDYPEYAEKVGTAVVADKGSLGILICGTGIGMSLAANKVKGVRAAACSEVYSAKLTRLHNDANVLCLGARVIGIETAKMMVDAFVETEFEGGRHQRRVDLITALEEKY